MKIKLAACQICSHTLGAGASMLVVVGCNACAASRHSSQLLATAPFTSHPAGCLPATPPAQVCCRRCLPLPLVAAPAAQRRQRPLALPGPTPTALPAANASNGVQLQQACELASLSPHSSDAISPNAACTSS